MVQACRFRVMRDDDVHGWLGASPDGLVSGLLTTAGTFQKPECRLTAAMCARVGCSCRQALSGGLPRPASCLVSSPPQARGAAVPCMHLNMPLGNMPAALVCPLHSRSILLRICTVENTHQWFSA